MAGYGETIYSTLIRSVCRERTKVKIPCLTETLSLGQMETHYYSFIVHSLFQFPLLRMDRVIGPSFERYLFSNIFIIYETKLFAFMSFIFITIIGDYAMIII